MQIQSLSQEDLLEEETATHSSILAWRIPHTEKPGGLECMESQSQTWLERHSVHCGIAWSCHLHKYLDPGRTIPSFTSQCQSHLPRFQVVLALWCVCDFTGVSFHTGVGFVSHLHCTHPHHTFSHLVVWLYQSYLRILEISLTPNIVEDINSDFTLFCCFLMSVWFDSQEVFGRDQILYCFYVLGYYHVTHPLWFYFRKSISWPYEKKKTWKIMLI